MNPILAIIAFILSIVLFIIGFFLASVFISIIAIIGLIIFIISFVRAKILGRPYPFTDKQSQVYETKRKGDTYISSDDQ